MHLHKFRTFLHLSATAGHLENDDLLMTESRGGAVSCVVPVAILPAL